MARKNWDEFYVKCPFFKADDMRHSIECEGLMPGHKLINKYAIQKDFKIQFDTFCMAKYENCELYQMLTKYYEEE